RALGLLIGGASSSIRGATLRPPETPQNSGLKLLTYRLLYDDGARIRDTEGIRELTQGSFAELSPADAQRLNIAHDAHVRVSSPHGSIELRAHVDDRIREGAVFVPWS